VIRIENLSISQGDFSLNGVNLDIPAGSYAALMGPSGCGKTTIMEALCGLREVRSGHIFVGDRDVTHLKPAERRIGYVPQDGALFPTFIVGDQIAFPMTLLKADGATINKRVRELAEQLEISHLLERLPANLSGGEKQRVALARALAMQPAALCFDEPLSALDEDLHDEICSMLRQIVNQHGVTALHITHSRKEAAAVADQVYRIDKSGGIIAVPAGE